MFRIEKEFKFEASHRLHKLTYESPCLSQHGHSYRVLVKISTDILNNSMVTDFTNLKTFQKWLDKEFDHATIIAKNDTEFYESVKSISTNKICLFPYDMTTAENMAECFAREIDSIFSNKISAINFIEVTVYETAKNSASYTLNH